MSIAVPFYSVRMDYSDVNVNTTDWQQLLASLPKTAQLVEIFDSSGETISLAMGAEGEEEQYLIILPGGNGKIPLFIPTLARLSLKSLTNDAVEGEIVINFYQQ